MYVLVAAMTKNNKIFQFIMFSVPINMMDVQTNAVSRACRTFIRKMFKGEFFVVSVSVLVRNVILSFNTFKSFAVFISKALILTLSTTVGAIFSSRRSKESFFTTVFANNRNKISCIPVMKTSSATKQLSSAFSRHYNKFTIALFAISNRFISPIFLTATYRAKSLPFVVGLKRSFTKFTLFDHVNMIAFLMNKDQSKHLVNTKTSYTRSVA
jgi:hypothetical protein